MLKIFAVSDQVESVVESPLLKERHGDADVVLSCGDLPYTYLEYIAFMLPVTCLYVHGNHDHDQLLSDGRILRKPGGWQNIDGKTVVVKNWIIGGLEGSISYRPFVQFQYTEAELTRKIHRMSLSLMMNRVLQGRYIDILITHSPPYGIHDGKDASHRGFAALLGFMHRFKPRVLLHGHQHRRNIDIWQTTFKHTQVVNIFPYRSLELTKD